MCTPTLLIHNTSLYSQQIYTYREKLRDKEGRSRIKEGGAGEFLTQVVVSTSH